MKLVPIAPTDALDIEQILNTLKLNQIQIIGPLVAGEVTLEHELTDDEFDKLILAMMPHHELKPQNPEWFPGTPTGDPEDFGYYVCPINPSDWNCGDFDMVITKVLVNWA